MTSNERAYAIADQCRQGMGLWTGDLVRLIANAIDDAVMIAIEEEREACAKVAEDAIGATRREIAAKIRARAEVRRNTD